MLIFTLNTNGHVASQARLRRDTGRWARFRKWIIAPVGRALLPALLLSAIAWPTSQATAVEFVTREAFNVEKNSYKEYPYRVLFQKFHNSTGEEKRRIRNVIILKQAFDPKFQDRATTDSANFESFYGVIKEINRDSLRLWLPESDSFKDFPMGIDRVPVENKHDYSVSAANAGHFAVIAQVLDNRVYQVVISFALPAPENLKVQRQDEHNVFSWQPAENAQAPTGYQVYVNDKLYKTVSATSVVVPRSREQADEFFVKAVYAHQKGRIISTASPTLYDAASAREIEKRQLAGKVYLQFTAALGQSDQQAARNLLDDNLPLLTDFLNPGHRAHILAAGAFFKALDEGDRLTALRPETADNLSAAHTAFQNAANEAGRLPADFQLSTVAGDRLTQNAEMSVRLTDRLQKEKARQTFDQISADLKPDRWEQARKRLYQQQTFLRQHLDPESGADVTNLADFFQAIEKGDLSADSHPPNPRQLETALGSYRLAEKKSRTLPPNLDAGFIARQRIKSTADRMASLSAAEQTRLATQTWSKLVVALNPSEWQNARTILFENRPALAAHLPVDKKTHMTSLVDFFTSLDEGDRQAAIQPPSLEKLEMATMYYQRAVRKAETLTENIDLGFITQIKISKLEKLKAQLTKSEQTARARKVYDQVLAALTPTDWESARTVLAENESLLTTQLAPDRKATVTKLTTYFQYLEDGDRLRTQMPVTSNTLNMALSSYRLADQKARDLAEVVDLVFLTDLKINTANEQRAALETQAQQARAMEVYQETLAALDQAGWETGMRLALDKLPPVTEHLESPTRALAELLIAFFQDIEAGDRLSFKRPETDSSLVEARGYYQQAESRANSMAGSPDVLFIARMRLDSLNIQRAELEKRQQALMAAQQAPVAPPIAANVTPPAPVTAPADTPLTTFDATVSKKSAYKLGLKTFRAQNYDLSLKYFNKVYAKQIKKLKKAGNKQSFAVLSLSPKIRAEIIFLVQLDLLKKSARGDEDSIRDGLMDIQDEVENGSGPWSIIRERKRDKILSHIERYPL